MSRLSKLFLTLTTLVVISFTAPLASAATLTIGSNASGSRYPYGLDPASATSAFPDFAAGGVYQQVYAASSFTGPMTITQLAFASSSQFTSGPGTANYNFNLSLGHTPAVPNALSTDLALNRGTDLTQVFTGAVPASVTGNDQFDLIVNITPFNYDPANGNLVLEITVNSPTQYPGAALYFVAGSDSRTNRAANPTGAVGGGFTDSFGLLTRFTTGAPTAASATISGEVVDANGAPLEGVTMKLLGGATLTKVTDEGGRFRFSNLDTNTFYTITPELANYHFAPRSRSFSLLGNKTDAVFTAAGNTDLAMNVIDSNDFFVRQQYLDFLNREPDRQGLQFWSAKLNECNGDTACLRERRIDVSAAFFQSLEFQQSGSYIYRLYEAALGRRPKYAEFTVDKPQIVGGASLDADKIAFIREFVTRPGFIEKYAANTTAESFVEAVLQTQLVATGVDSSSERSELVRRYNSGHTLSESRARALFNVAENQEFVKAVYNPAFVQMEYFGYLKREIDGAGYSFWLNVLNDRDAGNYRRMVCSFITSAEYQRRFGDVVTHDNSDCGD
ncbi:MAG TPA: DUF4214 domain-containing protein [Pyrinomonadaceae bacterium]|nr:DUF4214 domain-containing protein [Pyrinomonadaceae bacterium]